MGSITSSRPSMSVKDLQRYYSTMSLANVVSIIPLVVKSMSQHDTDGAVNSSVVGQKAIKSIVTARLNGHFQKLKV